MIAKIQSSDVLQLQFIIPILIITIPRPTPPIVPIHADSASGWTSQSIVGSITLQLRDKQTKQKHIKYAKTKKTKAKILILGMDKSVHCGIH